MEMSQRNDFWYQILLKMMIFFLKMAKNHLFGQKFLWQANKNCFELKMPKFLGNHVTDIDTLYYYASAESKRTQNGNQNSKMAGTELI